MALYFQRQHVSQGSGGIMRGEGFRRGGVLSDRLEGVLGLPGLSLAYVGGD